MLLPDRFYDDGFGVASRMSERGPSTRCDAALIIAGILAAASALTGAIGAGVANKQSGLKAQEKALNAAQGSGRLTPAGQYMVDAAHAQTQGQIDAAARQSAVQLANSGGTSGADTALINDSRNRAIAEGADRASAAFASQFAAEGQQAADIAAIRRDRKMEVVNFFTKGLSSMAGAMGAKAGYDQPAKTEKLDMGGDEAIKAAYADYQKMTPDQQAAWLAEHDMTAADMEQ